VLFDAHLPIPAGIVVLVGWSVLALLVLRRGVSGLGPWAVVVVAATRAVHVTVAAAGLRQSLVSLEFGQYLLTAESGFYRTLVERLLQREGIGVAVALVVFLLLSVVRLRLPLALERGEPACFAAVVALLGWPSVLLGFFTALLLALFTSVAVSLRARSLIPRVRLAAAAFAAAALLAGASLWPPAATILVQLSP
jgi:hypothetical protein